jgi:hypothetical protein
MAGGVTLVGKKKISVSGWRNGVQLGEKISRGGTRRESIPFREEIAGRTTRRKSIPFSKEITRRRTSRKSIPFSKEITRSGRTSARDGIGAPASDDRCQLVGVANLIVGKVNRAGKAWNGHTNKTRATRRENNRTGGEGRRIRSAKIKLALNFKQQGVMIEISGRARWAIQGRSVITNL